MARPVGSTDKHGRKTRSDLGKKRKTYAGKPIVPKRKITFERRIGYKEFLKIWIVQELPMSLSGLKRWNKKNRRHARKLIYKPLIVHQVHVSEIDTQKKIEDFLVLHYWSGTFIVRGFSNAKNKFHCKPVRLCRVVVKETSKGNVGVMRENWRLNRYSWFYKG